MKRLLKAIALLLLAPRLLIAQERGAVVLGESVAGLDVTTRVLVIGAHPDDEDTQLITWLARGRQVETAYLSLTRGDGGQNLIGNELGVQLGMIRTEELLAARRIDGGRQFFTRAFDFGFSKTAEETLKHWPADSILRDVVTVIRAFRPQIIVAIFSGTPADGHGHHQVSGILAREAYDAAADTVRFPRATTLGLGPWTTTKFYRSARFATGVGTNSNIQSTLSFNVGELSPFRGRTYAELASQSRSQHLSQGFGTLERRGTALDYVRLEASHVQMIAPEKSMFEGIATDWGRFAQLRAPSTELSLIDSIPSAIAAVRAVENLAAPQAMVKPLAKLTDLLTRARAALPCGGGILAKTCNGVNGDLAVTLETAASRARTALLASAGVLVEATAPRENLAVRDTLPITIAVYNQGEVPVVLEGASAWTFDQPAPPEKQTNVTIAPDSAAQVSVPIIGTTPSISWWLRTPKHGDVFELPPAGSSGADDIAIGEERLSDTHARAVLRIAGTRVVVDAGAVINRVADPARGEQRRPLSIVPGISALFDSEVEYTRADVPFDRTYNVRLHSSSSAPRGVAVTLDAPGLKVDTAVRRVAMEPFSDAVLTFHVSGKLTAGHHTVSATVTSGDERFVAGYVPLRYEHIRPLRFYRPAVVALEAVKADLPKNTTVAYIRGVGDNVAPMLSQLGLRVTQISAEELGSIDLAKFGSIVVGPRAFAASRALVQHAQRLQDFARSGGTVVVQYGQQEMQTPGILPFPITLQRTAERVTVEDAPVKVLDPDARVLSKPNRISSEDFAGWVQERSLYMPTTADPHYQHVFEMHDPNEAPNENALLIAPVGKGAYVYVTLALFRQLPAGVPGAARIFLNLIGADGIAPQGSLPRP